MPIWVLLAIGAQLLFAISVLVDRQIVTKDQHIGKPIVYAFYVSLLSGFVLVFVPFGVVGWPGGTLIALSAAYAASFMASIFFLYSALRLARASDVAPAVGAISAITTLILAHMWI